MLCFCLALAACHGNVNYRGPSVNYQGPAHPVAIVAVGAVMAFELAALAAPAFTVEGTKPRTRAVDAHAATPVGSPDTLVLMTLSRGPAQTLSLAELAETVGARMKSRGLALVKAQGWSLDDPDAFRFSRLKQRGLRRALTVALDVLEKDNGTEAVAQLRMMNVTTRESLAHETLRRSVLPGETPAQAHAALAVRMAEAMARMLAVEKAGPAQ